MFATKCKKNGKIVTITGNSKGQVKRKLCQMGLDFTKYKIVECTDGICPVCGCILRIDDNGILVSKEPNKCFFCMGGIKLN